MQPHLPPRDRPSAEALAIGVDSERPDPAEALGLAEELLSRVRRERETVQALRDYLLARGTGIGTDRRAGDRLR